MPHFRWRTAAVAANLGRLSCLVMLLETGWLTGLWLTVLLFVSQYRFTELAGYIRRRATEKLLSSWSFLES